MARELLSFANYTHEYDPPTSIDKKRMDDEQYSTIYDLVVVSDFSSNHTLDGCCDEGYYRIFIYLEGYEDDVRYYAGRHPNEQTQELADIVLGLWD